MDTANDQTLFLVLIRTGNFIMPGIINYNFLHRLCTWLQPFPLIGLRFGAHERDRSTRICAMGPDHNGEGNILSMNILPSGGDIST